MYGSSPSPTKQAGGGKSELEEQMILRLPLPLAEQMRKMIRTKQLNEEIEFEFEDNGRKADFKMGRKRYDAYLCDLPCVFESYKTLDKTNYYKSADIGQMLVVSGNEDEETTLAADNKLLNGFTPPTRDVRRRKWRKRRDPMEMSQIENEVLRLLKPAENEIIEILYPEECEDLEETNGVIEITTPAPKEETRIRIKLTDITEDAKVAVASTPPPEEKEKEKGKEKEKDKKKKKKKRDKKGTEEKKEGEQVTEKNKAEKGIEEKEGEPGTEEKKKGEKKKRDKKDKKEKKEKKHKKKRDKETTPIKTEPDATQPSSSIPIPIPVTPKATLPPTSPPVVINTPFPFSPPPSFPIPSSIPIASSQPPSRPFPLPVPSTPTSSIQTTAIPSTPIPLPSTPITPPQVPSYSTPPPSSYASPPLTGPSSPPPQSDEYISLMQTQKKVSAEVSALNSKMAEAAHTESKAPNVIVKGRVAARIAEMKDALKVKMDELAAIEKKMAELKQ